MLSQSPTIGLAGQHRAYCKAALILSGRRPCVGFRTRRFGRIVDVHRCWRPKL
jgi:hypothetical protein